jgi:uncharacterized protein (DUF2236 family)
MAGTPDTVSRRVNAERIVLLGWSRAILMQLAHPLVAAGVAEHSTFRGGRLAAAVRLHHTVRAMLALTFGDDRARTAALDEIRSIHRRVHGLLPVAAGPFSAGTPYSAEDPALVLWVHATLLDSIPLVYDRVIAPLTGDEHNAYCAEAAAIAVDLGAHSDEVPRTRAALMHYLDRVYASGAIVVSPQARALAGSVLSPFSPLLGAAIAPAAAVNRLVTIGLLPPAVRGQYGFGWNDARERWLQRTLGGARLIRTALPRRAALWREAR